jgi:ketopantoate reductase
VNLYLFILNDGTCITRVPLARHLQKSTVVQRMIEIHATTDGAVTLQVRKSHNEWIATYCGSQLDGGLITTSEAEAVDEIREAFRQMFPEHDCTNNCRVGCRSEQVS